MLFAAMDSLATTVENVPACGLQHGILEDNQSGPRHHLPKPAIFPISCQFSFHHFWINQTQGEPFIHPVISGNSRWEISAKFSTIPWTILVPDLILGNVKLVEMCGNLPSTSERAIVGLVSLTGKILFQGRRHFVLFILKAFIIYLLRYSGFTILY